ncbi:hypothetical protein IGS73_14805 [Janibacter indicus]|uniref:Uncharacterized protein n=1 Tax=Janibacter indicus TaxID=857417 RepID=A0A7L9IYY6_9MICO|nr:hypothetical protein [Janibacter indicus]QOK22339.1 hypothetical protein IGS73_14805 [Janibacter indicus]
MNEYDFRPPNLAEAHSQWHAIHGKYAVCDLDCGANEGLMAEYEEMAQVAHPQVACGHCKGRHTIAGVAACAAAHREP